MSTLSFIFATIASTSLAQSASASSRPQQVLLLVGLLMGLTLAGGLVVFLLRRRIFAKTNDMSDDAGLMGSLRKMRDTGQISDEEYETTRKAMARRAVERATKQSTPSAPAAAPTKPSRPA